MSRARTRPTSEPPISPQPLPEPTLSPGQRAIPLHKMIGGNKRHPHTLRFAVVAYAIVDEADYSAFSSNRWFARWADQCRSYAPVRKEPIDGKTVAIYLAREILGLPRNPGRACNQQADHLDHNPLNNTRANLRVATYAQNNANRRRDRDATRRFRGVQSHGRGFQACFKHDGSQLYVLPTVPVEAEAAFMFNHAVRLLRDPHAQVNDIPPHELPSQQRQDELTALVQNKLRSKGLIP